MNSNFVDDKEEANQWMEVSKNVKSGEDVDEFTADIARDQPA